MRAFCLVILGLLLPLVFGVNRCDTGQTSSSPVTRPAQVCESGLASEEMNFQFWSHACPIRLSARPRQAMYELSEPVWIELRFDNVGQRLLAISLDFTDDSSIQLTWKPVGNTEKPLWRHRPPRGGRWSFLHA
jgi:hypothetical protein